MSTTQVFNLFYWISHMTYISIHPHYFYTYISLYLCMPWRRYSTISTCWVVSCVICHETSGSHLCDIRMSSLGSQIHGQFEYLQGYTNHYCVTQCLLFGKLLLFCIAPSIPPPSRGLRSLFPICSRAALCSKVVPLQTNHSQLSEFFLIWMVLGIF